MTPKTPLFTKKKTGNAYKQQIRYFITLSIAAIQVRNFLFGQNFWLWKKMVRIWSEFPDYQDLVRIFIFFKYKIEIFGRNWLYWLHLVSISPKSFYFFNKSFKNTKKAYKIQKFSHWRENSFSNVHLWMVLRHSSHTQIS